MLRLQPKQYGLLGICIAAGIVWISILQNWLLLNIFSDILAGPGLNLENFLQTGSSPSFTALWITCFFALLFWLFVTSRSNPRNSDEVLRKKSLWWIIAGILSVLGCLYQQWYMVLVWIGLQSKVYPITPGGNLLLIFFVIFDVLLLFWLPTVLATPRNFRLVAPGAVKLFGGR